MTTGESGEVRTKKEKVYFKHVNLYDIPKGIIPTQTYEMAETMREENLQEWRHIIMGEVRRSSYNGIFKYQGDA